jgi:hypothetical protein
MWAIWYVPRKVIYENSFQNLLSTHCFVDMFMAELDQLKPEKAAPSTGARANRRWILPPEGSIKISVDAAISKNSGRVSPAVLARNRDGSFAEASVLVVEGCTEPEVMEVIACQEGLALASDLALRGIKVDSDNNNVVRNIFGVGMGPYGQIVHEIRSSSRAFELCEFVN